MRQVSLIFSYRFPGRYAMNALAGALETADDLGALEVCFPRELPSLVQAVRQALAAGRTVIVAWSFYSPSFQACALELQALRAAVGDRFLSIAGGVHATAEPLDVLRAGFELVCVGEGERALLELLRRASHRLDTVRESPGFARLEAGALVQSARAAPVELDGFPPFSARFARFGAIELTRGCVYACRFCQTPFFSKARFRHRSVENTARWVRALAAADKPDVRFTSPTALSYGSSDESVNLPAVEALLAAAREALDTATPGIPSAPLVRASNPAALVTSPLHAADGDASAAGARRHQRRGRLFFGTFPSELRPEHVTPASLAVLRRFVDNDNLIIGAQSGSNRVLEASGRGHDVEAVTRAVRLCLEAGFLPNVDFILGLPGEGPEDLRATVTLMKELAGAGARVHGHSFLPLPGTPFRDAAPGFIDDATRLELERLASQRRLYGNWKQQERVAQALLERRRG